MRYVALLRGINVGGKNLIKMAALKACFEDAGMADVSTYIASGNVLLTSGQGAAALARRLEDALEATFGARISVVLRTRAQMRAVLARAPAGFGTQPATYRYDALFLKAPLTAAAAMKVVPVHPEVDTLDAGPGVLYSSRLIARATASRLGKVTALPVYKAMTIRNWATTSTLARLVDE